MRLFDMRMADGSRHFGDLPETYDVAHPEWHRIRDMVPRLAGATLSSFTTDDVTEAWILFEFRGHSFSMNNQHGSWWFFVTDPNCPDDILATVLDHFEALLNPHASVARTGGPLDPGAYRVVVYEPDTRITIKDFTDPKQAQRYADDAASETETGIVTSYVLNGELRVVHVGVHY